MALILNIETATKACSVALCRDGETIASQELREDKFSHAEKLHLFIEEVVKKGDSNYSEIEAISVGMGPGSYTGLRIGVSTAKGLAFAKNIPLIAVPTLQTLSYSMIQMYPEIEYFCPMLDARRMEVYTAIYDRNLTILEPVDAMIVDAQFRKELLEKNKVLFFGDGSDKLHTLIKDEMSEESKENYVFKADQFPSAIQMASLSEQKFLKKDFVDTAYFEPFYLKDFIAGKPKKI